MAIKGRPPLREAIQIGNSVTRPWAMWFDSIALTLRDDTYLVNNVYGTAGEIDVADNGDGSITLSFSSNIFSSNILPTVNETTVTTNLDDSVTIGIDDNFLPTYVIAETDETTVTDLGSGSISIGIADTLLPTRALGTTDEIDVTAGTGGTVAISISDSCFSSHISGTAQNVEVADDGDGTVTLFLSDTISINQDIVLTDTTFVSPYGIIYKGTDTFIHDFNYGDNGTVTTVGYNTFIGVGAGNLTMGQNATAWFHSSYNVGIGWGALTANDNGYGNLAVGSSALYKNTNGTNNVAIGANAILNNLTGGNNVGIGHSALKNSTGSNNVGIGQASLYLNTSASNSTGVGQASLYNNTGAGNTATGKNAGYSNTTGIYNCYFGYYAGQYTDALASNQTSSYCCYFGGSSKASADGVQYEVVIGYGAVGKGSYTVTLGGSNNTDVYANGNIKAVSGGVTPNEGGAGTRPTASASVRGMIWVTQNGSGVADTVEICLKSSADTYSWVTIATG